ncbi:MAG TPA: type II toxin-antitoxin system PemK/MazF family toxin [Pirellulaceae bacterium]|jgi:mRNA interferase MazF
MGKPVAGEVVVIPFPQTDLKVGKPRPALVLVDLPGDDLILAQITSQFRQDGFSISLAAADFAGGQLPVASYIRPNRLFTIDKSVVLRRSGHVRSEKLDAVLVAVRQIFS